MASTGHNLSIGNVENFNKVTGAATSSRRMSCASRRSSFSNSTTGEYSRRRRTSRHSFSFNQRNSKLSSATDGKPTKPIVKLENTYKMEPDEREKFRPGPIEQIIKRTFEMNMTGVVYEPKSCGIYAQRLAEEIKERVRELNFKRYKVIVQVLINSKNKQSCEMASRALWNTDTDNFASYTYQSSSLVAIGLVHAAYYE